MSETTTTWWRFNPSYDPDDLARKLTVVLNQFRARGRAARAQPIEKLALSTAFLDAVTNAFELPQVPWDEEPSLYAQCAQVVMRATNPRTIKAVSMEETTKTLTCAILSVLAPDYVISETVQESASAALSLDTVIGVRWRDDLDPEALKEKIAQGREAFEMSCVMDNMGIPSMISLGITAMRIAEAFAIEKSPLRHAGEGLDPLLEGLQVLSRYDDEADLGEDAFIEASVRVFLASLDLSHQWVVPVERG